MVRFVGERLYLPAGEIVDREGHFTGFRQIIVDGCQWIERIGIVVIQTIFNWGLTKFVFNNVVGYTIIPVNIIQAKLTRRAIDFQKKIASMDTLILSLIKISRS